MPQFLGDNITFYQLPSALSFVLFLQNYQINACPSSVQNTQICAKVLQQKGEGCPVHLGLQLPASPLHCIASPNRKRWGGRILAIRITTF